MSELACMFESNLYSIFYIIYIIQYTYIFIPKDMTMRQIKLKISQKRRIHIMQCGCRHVSIENQSILCPLNGSVAIDFVVFYLFVAVPYKRHERRMYNKHRFINLWNDWIEFPRHVIDCFFVVVARYSMEHFGFPMWRWSLQTLVSWLFVAMIKWYSYWSIFFAKQ